MSSNTHTTRRAATAALPKNPPAATAPTMASLTEMLRREATAKATAEAERMRRQREERERQRIAAEQRAKAEAEHRATLEAERKAAAERHRVAAAKADMARREREIVKWESTFKVHAALGDLLERLVADEKRPAEEREFMCWPNFCGHNRAADDILEYVRYALGRSREVLLSGNTGRA